LPKKSVKKTSNQHSNGRRSGTGASSSSRDASGRRSKSRAGAKTSRQNSSTGVQGSKPGRPSSRRSNSRPGKDASTQTRFSSNKASTRVDENTAKHKQPEESSNSKAYFVDVDTEHDGQRVDNFLVTHLKGVPKTHIYRIIRKGEVRVNKGRVKQTTRLKEGDSIRIPPIRLSESSTGVIDGSRYEFLKKTVLFEDDALLIINKPSGMAVHAGSGIKVGVIEALRALRTDLKYLELVHRLDRATSGCLVLAKKSSALKILHEDFKTNSLKNKRLDKRYLALAKGQWKFGSRRITKALNTNARKHGERYVVVDDEGSYASSIVNPLDASSVASLLEVTLLTGRTHQVRVHLQSEGHPIAGDERYGDETFNKAIKKNKLSRLFLHASQLRFSHPISEALVTVSAPLPEDLKLVLESLNLNSN